MIFITGINGFIGRALAARFDDARGVDLTGGPGVVVGDISAPGAWQDHVAGCEVVVHTAAMVSGRAGDRAAMWRANVEGTRHAYEAAERAGAKRFVHLSTVVTFGVDFEDGVDERAPVRPTGLPYGDTKIAAEQFLLQAHAEGRLPVTILRPGDVYGPGSKPWATVPYELIRARRFVLPDGGRGIFSPVYVDDLVDGMASAVDVDATAGQVITLAGGIGVPNRDFFAPFAKLAGRRLLTAPTKVALAGAAVSGRLDPSGELNSFSARYLLRRGTYSIAKARDLIGYAPRISLDEGLDRTLTWLATSAGSAPR